MNWWGEDVVPQIHWRLRTSVTFLRHNTEGERFPPGYGIAWHDYQCRAYVLMPVPINFIAGALRKFYLRMIEGVVPAEIDRKLEEAYDRGRLAACEHMAEFMEVRYAPLLEHLRNK